MREGDVASGALLLIDPATERRLSTRAQGHAGASPASAFKRAVLAELPRHDGREHERDDLHQPDLRRIIAFGVVYNAARVSLSERSRELASLRVLGFTRAEISLILLGELAVLTVVRAAGRLAVRLRPGVLHRQNGPERGLSLSAVRLASAVAWAWLAILAAAAVSGLVGAAAARSAGSGRGPEDSGVEPCASLRFLRIGARRGLVVGGITAVALWPERVEVEVAAVTRGPMQVTIDEDGETRVRERFVISAPVSGRSAAHRARARRSGHRGKTVVARIAPADAPLIDARTRAELQAAVAAAQASVGQARAERDRAAAARDRAALAARRQQKLVEVGAVSRDDLEAAQTTLAAATTSLQAAEFALARAEHELQLARRACKARRIAAGSSRFARPSTAWS